MVYPKHVQSIFNMGHCNFNQRKLVDSYYNSLALMDLKDTPENFKLAAYCFMDGHVAGFEKGVQSHGITEHTQGEAH